MAIKLHFFIASAYFLTLISTNYAENLKQFTFSGFKQANLHLDGGATVLPNGLLQLTNTSKLLTGHAFIPVPLNFTSPSSLSFSTTFVFAMVPEVPVVSAHGITFVIAPSMHFRRSPGKYFGIFDNSTVGNSSNHKFAVEFDTMLNMELKDIDSNHVGIDVNSVESVASASAGYLSDADRQNRSLNLISGKPMQTWIEYDDRDMVIEVTMVPLGVPKPSKPLVSTRVNLSEIVLDTMYVGFSATTGSIASSSNYVLGWSFSHGPQTQAVSLDLSKLPSLPRLRNQGSKSGLGTASIVLVIVACIMVLAIGLVMYMRWWKKFDDILEDWEKEYVIKRFSYRDLYKSTKGFKDRELLGTGGFGKVYKGTLPSTKVEIAVKKVSHGSNQGMKEFVSEIACMGRLRHRNLVQLLGYCRRKGELILVYDFMPNGSLDKYLYHGKRSLSWCERFKVIKDVTSALLYLHEEWEQVVVHRDVKASNVLLDANMNARLGDFGLARLYDHGTNPQTTHIVGTIGYLAPELTRKGKATTSTDVFSFGIFVLEVACGRTPISLQSDCETYLVDWVYNCWQRGAIVEAMDRRLEGNCVLEETELVLKLGMICSNPRAEERPSMRQVMQILDGEISLPAIIPSDAKPPIAKFNNQTLPSFSSSSEGMSIAGLSTDSILITGR